MFKRISLTSVTEGGDATITLGDTIFQLKKANLTAGGKEAVTTCLTVYGGANGGECAIVATAETGIATEAGSAGIHHFTVGAHECVIVNTREVLEPTQDLYFGASDAGVKCSISADVSEVQ